MLNRIVAALVLLVSVLVVGACASVGGMSEGAMAPEPGGYAEESYAKKDVAGADSAPVAPTQHGGLEFSRSDRRLAQAEAGPAPAPPTSAATEGADPSTASAPPPSQPDAQIAGPLLIYTAQIGMSVFETAKALDTLEKMARDSGGYLVTRNDTKITIRVPASKFDAVLAKTMELGDVLERNVEVRDVTEEYYDLQTRLRNKEAVLKRLTELLQKADKVEDALKVEAQLARVAGEVERMKGRLKLLRELVSFSTITVSFAPQQREQIDTQIKLPFPWLGGLGLSNLMSL